MMENEKQRDLSPEDKRKLLSRWIPRLFLIQAVSLAALTLSAFCAGAVPGGWIGRIVSALTVFVLFHLAPVSVRYRNAAAFRCATLVGSLVADFGGASVLSSVASLCAIAASYQEYYAHGEAVLECDAPLAGKWERMFLLELMAGLLTSVITIAAAVTGVLGGYEVQTLTDVILAVNAGINLLLKLIYLRYLGETRAFVLGDA